MKKEQQSPARAPSSLLVSTSQLAFFTVAPTPPHPHTVALTAVVGETSATAATSGSRGGNASHWESSRVCN